MCMFGSSISNGTSGVTSLHWEKQLGGICRTMQAVFSHAKGGCIPKVYELGQKIISRPSVPWAVLQTPRTVPPQPLQLPQNPPRSYQCNDSELQINKFYFHLSFYR